MSSISNTEIEEVLTRRRDAIISEIYNSFFSADDPAQVTIIDIFNSLMLLVQTSIMFVLVSFDSQRQAINDDPNDYINFNQHPFHQDKIRDAVTKAKEDNAFFEIFGVEEKRLVILKTSDDASQSKKYTFKALKPEKDYKHDVYGYQLSKLLDKDIYLTRFGEGFLKILQKIVKDCEFSLISSIISRYKPLPKNEKEKYERIYEKFKESLKKEYELLGIKYDGVLNQAYKKSKNALNFIPDINSNKEPLVSIPNFLFFVRDYSSIEEYARHDYYNSGLSILICEEQEKDIEDYFIKLKNHKKFFYSLYNERTKDTDNKYKNILNCVHDDFWDKLENNGKNDILIALKTPFKKGSYSMSDPCFMSGLIHFRDLKINFGIHRSLYEEDNNNELPAYKLLTEEKRQELLRIVTVYYLFLGMSRGIKENNTEHDICPSVMLCPVNVGGKVFGVVSYVTFNRKSNQSVVEYSAAWRQNYHMFSAGHRRFKRNLRNYVWRSYVVFVSYIFCEQIRETERNNDFKITNFQFNLNKKFNYLSRFFSFSTVNASFKLMENGEEGIFKTIGMDLTISKNDFFSSIYGSKETGRFTNINEINRRIRDEFILRKD